MSIAQRLEKLEGVVGGPDGAFRVISISLWLPRWRGRGVIRLIYEGPRQVGSASFNPHGRFERSNGNFPEKFKILKLKED